jgi:hypothetical protein
MIVLDAVGRRKGQPDLKILKTMSAYTEITV